MQKRQGVQEEKGGKEIFWNVCGVCGSLSHREGRYHIHPHFRGFLLSWSVLPPYILELCMSTQTMDLSVISSTIG